MSTEELINRLKELGDWGLENQWEVPVDLGEVCIRAAVTIEVLMEEVRKLCRRY